MTGLQKRDLSFITIIIPIRNESSYIERSLRSVLSQDYPSDRMEILIVDGMSTDATRNIVAKTVEQIHSPVVHVLDNPHRIVPTAFNIGLRQAQGDIIIRVDGHCEITPNYVRRCVELLRDTQADNVGGIQVAVSKTVTGKAIALATSSPFGVGSARFHYANEPGWVDTVYLGAYRREVFERIGGFDEEMVRNQDDEFNFRLTQAGGKIWLDPSIQSIYYSRATFRGLWKQYYQYGFYKVRLIQKRGAVPSWRHLVPGAFVFSLITGLLISLLTRKSRFALGVTVPYAATNVAASLCTARKDWKTLPFLPLAFLILHLSYGIGFLAGIWYWSRKPLKKNLTTNQS